MELYPVWETLLMIAIPVVSLNFLKAFQTREYVFVEGAYFTLLGIVTTVIVFTSEPVKLHGFPYEFNWFFAALFPFLAILFFYGAAFGGETKEETRANTEQGVGVGNDVE